MKRIKNASEAVVFASFFVVAMCSSSPPAQARSTVDSPYPVEQIWSTAVRFLRVDQRFPVLEKDKDAGYILFDYVEDATKVHKASLELVSFVQKGGLLGTKVILTIRDKPRHVESLLLEKLERKAQEELGPPPRPRREAAKPGSEGRKQDPDPAPKDRPKETEADPNQPVRGDDGLPRFPQHKDLPRPPE